MTTIQNQNYGVEIELTGITRRRAAGIIASYFGTYHTENGGDYYHSVYAYDRKGRKWRCMSDSSISCRVKNDGEIRYASSEYSCEVVTPILQYEDLEDLQEIVRNLRKADAMANESCGIHVHVDGANHTPQSLVRLLGFSVGRQDLFYEALQIGDRGSRWCRRTNAALLAKLRTAHVQNFTDVEKLWYSNVNDSYTGGISHEHYNSTRYHGVNLHAFFTKGTVEFRLFNGTTHAGKIKAYVQFCLAMSAWAINADDAMWYKDISHYTQAQKAAIMDRCLRLRLGMTGSEFKTARFHLTQAFKADADQIAA